MNADETRIYGRGIAFPPRLGMDGRIAWSTGAENVRENIRIILLTALQERIMLPQFGGGLRQFLFQPNVTTTHRLIEEAIVQSLGRWEPRIRVDSVTVEADPEDGRSALVVIRYTLVAGRTGDQVRLRVQLAS